MNTRQLPRVLLPDKLDLRLLSVPVEEPLVEPKPVKTPPKPVPKPTPPPRIDPAEVPHFVPADPDRRKSPTPDPCRKFPVCGENTNFMF